MLPRDPSSCPRKYNDDLLELERWGDESALITAKIVLTGFVLALCANLSDTGKPRRRPPVCALFIDIRVGESA